MQKLISIVTSLFFTAIIIAACLFAYIAYQSLAPNKLSEAKIVTIKNGSSVRAIANNLYDEGIINNHLVFLIKARLANRNNSLKSGEYKFEPKISIKDTIAILQSGKNLSYDITFAEGLTSREIIEIINNNEILSGDKIEGIPSEGSLLPETYSFIRGDSKQSIVTRMQNSLNQNIDKLWETRQENLPIKSKEEALILASIVEKETSIPAERNLVAGVFINRLNKNMPLQTDPTVIYAITLGKYKLERPLTFKDLKMKSPYNTYTVRGLPPTPIANAGIDSIKAVLNPEYTDYIYFVADGTGGHAFAKTLEEHNRNVANWRKIRRNKNK